MTTNPLLAAASALALALPAAAQGPLCSINPFASNNGGSVGGAVYFDLKVTNPIRITGIDTNYSATAGTPVGMTVHLYTAGSTAFGNETDIANWQQIGMDDGNATSAGTDMVTAITLAAPVLLLPGDYGIALVAAGSGHRYTNGNGNNQNFNTADVAIALGSASNAPFTGSIFNPRIWNGCLHYTLGNGIFPNFDASPTVGVSPLPVQFKDLTYSSDPGGVGKWAWDIDNNGTVDFTIQHPQHTYTAGGKYSVKLDVADPTNGSASLTKSDLILVDQVEVDFSGTPTSGFAPLNVQFTDLTQYGPTAWAWDFDNDGTVDSTDQNPANKYGPGSFTVKLSAKNASSSGSATKTDYVNVGDPSIRPGTADTIELQFNEVRGTTTANTGTAATGPATVSNAGWHGDPGRPLFQGNEPGFGMLAYTGGATGKNLVQTGWPMNVTGDLTIMWWYRMASAPGTTLAYAFGGPSSNMRCFTGGVAGTGIWYRGSSLGDIVTTNINTQADNNWHHIAVVIDDANGVATWYQDGVPDVPQPFTPATHTASNTGFNVAYHTSTSSTFTRFYDMDDFRLYTSALNGAQVLSEAAFAHENAAASEFGAGCAGPSGVPTIGSSGGAPNIGNLGFAIDLAGAEPGVPTSLNIHLIADGGGLLPIDISWLLGPGCAAETLPLWSLPLAHAGSGSVAVPIPALPSLAGWHLYAQYLLIGSTGAATAGLDVNIQE